MYCKTKILPLVLLSTILLGQFPVELTPEEMAADKGALTPEVMQTFLEQQSAQKGNNQTPKESPTSDSICTSCGGQVQMGWIACPKCGNQL